MEIVFHKSFYHNGERLFSYPLDTEADDSQLATVEYLAFERGCSPDDIAVMLEQCSVKALDFSHNCLAQRVEGHSDEEHWHIYDVSTGKLHRHEGPLDDFIALYEAGMA